jgi:hypothetical protein
MRSSGWAALAVCIVATSATHPGAASAQGLDGARAGVVAHTHSDSAIRVTPNVSAAATSASWRPKLGLPSLTPQQRRTLAPIASAAIPGSGQWLLGQNRALGFLAVEAIAWWRYTTDIHQRTLQEERFKDIARRVARAPFSTSPPDGDWAFYERMRDYLESGQYSMSDTGPVVPETDQSTFNGSRWALAQATNPISTPTGYAAALAEYERTAVKPEFQWSWKNNQFQLDIFKRYTEKRNDADRAATRDLLVIGANHIISMVDAFTTMRLQVRSEADGRVSVGSSFHW